MSFSENLQNLRNSKNLTQEELAEKLNVSRQAVSKWESGSGYPETEKIIQICEIFDCSMDTLMKGKISADTTNDKKEYDKFYNIFSKGIAGAVGIILIGVTVLILLSGFQNEKINILGVICLMLCVLVAVPIFIYLGISYDNFKKTNPAIANIYSDEEIKSYNKKFAIAISASVSLIIFGVIILIMLYAFEIVNINESLNQTSTLPITILLCFITIAVPIIVYFSIQKDKYDVNNYNNQNKLLNSKNEELIGKISGVIMLGATFIFLTLGFIFDLWHICWVAFPLGGVLCGIVGTIFTPNS